MDLPLNIDFTGKVVVVTGAGGVLCGTMARAFAQAGAKVAALDLNKESVEKLAKEAREEGYICNGYQANVLDVEELEAVHQQVLSDFGPCDILVNGAGGNNPRATTDNEYQHEKKEGQKTFFDLEPNGVDFVFKLNFQGTLLPTQAFAKEMADRKSGCILNVSSMNAYVPLTKIPAYSGAKAAVSNLPNGLPPILLGQGYAAMPLRQGFWCQTRTGRCSFRRMARLRRGPIKFWQARLWGGLWKGKSCWAQCFSCVTTRRQAPSLAWCFPLTRGILLIQEYKFRKRD